eukprot:6090081-Pleurochrysis_carterae.AAC.1
MPRTRMGIDARLHQHKQTPQACAAGESGRHQSHSHAEEQAHVPKSHADTPKMACVGPSEHAQYAK